MMRLLIRALFGSPIDRRILALAKRAPDHPTPFEDFGASPRIRDEGLVREARAMIDGGWARWGHRLETLRPPIPWTGARGSFDLSLAGLEPMTILIPAWETSRDDVLFEAIVDFATDWIESHPIVKETPTRRTIATIARSRDTSTWNDMVTGRRLHVLAYVLDMIARRGGRTSGTIGTYITAVEFHHRLLAHPRHFNTQSNHGLYQVLGQLAAARRLEADLHHGRWVRLAERRLSRLLRTQVFPSGVHKEHTPAYQYMVMGTLVGAAGSGLIRAPEQRRLIAAMQDVLADMIAPDGNLVPIGDGDPRPMRWTPAKTEALSDPGLRHVLTGGKVGTPRPEGVRAYLREGWAFARMTPPGLPQGPQTTAYLAQTCGYHSEIHKQADHLAFVWYDRGCEILTDPGRWGYGARTPPRSDLHRAGFRFSDPRRIYVEETRAHNCVEIDGRSDRRGPRHRFGSALVDAKNVAGVAVMRSDLAREQGPRQRRTLIMVPGLALLVIDRLESRVEHSAIQWFKFAPGWRLDLADGNVIGRRPSDAGTGPTLAVIDCMAERHRRPRLHFGDTDPELNGWLSDAPNNMVPATSLAVPATPGRETHFATLFVWAEGLLSVRSDLSTDLVRGSFELHTINMTTSLTFDTTTQNMIVSLTQKII